MQFSTPLCSPVVYIQDGRWTRGDTTQLLLQVSLISCHLFSSYLQVSLISGVFILCFIISQKHYHIALLYFSALWMLKYNHHKLPKVSTKMIYSGATDYASIRKSCIGSNCERYWVTYNNLKLGYLHNVTLYWHHCFALLHLKEFLRKPSKTTLRFFSRGGVTSQFC